jgi:hypothetical protein
MNGEIWNPVGNGSNAASHVFAVHFDFAGIAGSNQAACGNGDVGPLGDSEERFARSRGGAEIIREKLNGDYHGGVKASQI